MRVAVTVENDVSALIPSGEGNAEQITTNIDMPEKLEAPITKGDVLGTVTYSYKGIEVGSLTLSQQMMLKEIIFFTYSTLC